MAQYKCIPAPINVRVEKRGGLNAAAKAFESIMNQEAKNGWKYCSTETLTVTEPSGCMSQSTVTTTTYMLIFINE